MKNVRGIGHATHITEGVAEGVAEKNAWNGFSAGRVAERAKNKTDRSEQGESFNWTTKIRLIFFYNSDKENPNRNQYLVLRENVYMSRFDFWGWEKSLNFNFLEYFSQKRICEKFAIKIKAWLLFHNCCSHSCLISIGIELQAKQSF